jgi:hypothetical protein
MFVEEQLAKKTTTARSVVKIGGRKERDPGTALTNFLNDLAKSRNSEIVSSQCRSRIDRIDRIDRTDDHRHQE